MATFQITDLANYYWVCQSRGDLWEAADLLYVDRDHKHGEPDRALAFYPYDQVEVSELRCKCGSSVTPVPKED